MRLLENIGRVGRHWWAFIHLERMAFTTCVCLYGCTPCSVTLDPIVSIELCSNGRQGKRDEEDLEESVPSIPSIRDVTLMSSLLRFFFCFDHTVLIFLRLFLFRVCPSSLQHKHTHPHGKIHTHTHQAVMLTELWWGIASYGKWGTSTERSCAGGGFAACLPSRLRQLGWSFVGSMCGINSVNLYTQVN